MLHFNLSLDNALALYSKGILQRKLHGGIDPGVLATLRNQLDVSSFWRARFDAFGLTYEDLL